MLKISVLPECVNNGYKPFNTAALQLQHIIKDKEKVMPSKQQGISLVSGLVILVFVALLAITVIKIIPLYYDNYLVSQILEQVKDDLRRKV